MDYQKKKIFVLVKTYPNLSSKYGELVCTAGVTEDGEWVRLYPVDYRYRPYGEWFDKYQWIEAAITRHTEDPRKESYRPDIGTLSLLEKVDTQDNWFKRKEMFLPLLNSSVEQLVEQVDDEVSLGIIQPKKITNFVIEEGKRDWSPKEKSILAQENLFGPKKKPLDKIPYKFSYKFQCDNEECKGHKMMIEDWEIFQLYRNCLARASGNEKEALKKVQQKYLGFAQNNDVYLILGTTRKHHRFRRFLIIGVCYPKKEALSLF